MFVAFGCDSKTTNQTPNVTQDITSCVSSNRCFTRLLIMDFLIPLESETRKTILRFATKPVIEIDDILLLCICLLWSVYYLRTCLTKPDPSHAIWYQRPQRDQTFVKAAKEKNAAKLMETSVCKMTWK